MLLVSISKVTTFTNLYLSNNNNRFCCLFLSVHFPTEIRSSSDNVCRTTVKLDASKVTGEFKAMLNSESRYVYRAKLPYENQAICLEPEDPLTVGVLPKTF